MYIVSKSNCRIWLIVGSYPGQSGPGNDDNEELLSIPITPALMQPHHQIVWWVSLKETYPSAEMQLMYSRTLANWANGSLGYIMSLNVSWSTHSILADLINALIKIVSILPLISLFLQSLFLVFGDCFQHTNNYWYQGRLHVSQWFFILWQIISICPSSLSFSLCFLPELENPINDNFVLFLIINSRFGHLSVYFSKYLGNVCVWFSWKGSCLCMLVCPLLCMHVCILLFLTHLRVFTLSLADDFSLEFEWEQVSISFPDSSQYFRWSL